MSRLRDSSLGQAWLILVLATAFGAALTAVHTGLGPRIEANVRAETLRQLPAMVLPAAELDGSTIEVAGDRIAIRWAGREPLALAVAENAVAGHLVYSLSRADDGAPVGHVVRAKGPGYADEIELLLGLSGDLERLTGMYVLTQKETPALGDGITKPAFQRWFAGAPADAPLTVTKSQADAESHPGRVLALTAATISSRSVCDIVNKTLALVRPALAARLAPSADAAPAIPPAGSPIQPTAQGARDGR